jgi:hypothetical protein
VRLPTLAGTSSRGLRSLPERGFFCVIRNNPVRTLRRHGGFAVQISGPCWRRGRETRSVPCSPDHQGSGHGDGCEVAVKRLTCMNTVDTAWFTIHSLP